MVCPVLLVFIKFNQPITIRRSGDIETAHIIHLEEGKKSFNCGQSCHFCTQNWPRSWEPRVGGHPGRVVIEDGKNTHSGD